MSGTTFRISGFPSLSTANGVTEFLEKYAGEGTVIALKLRKCKKSRMYAIVQFSRKEDAQDLSYMIQRRKVLFYDGSYLKIHNAERDIIPKPRKSLFVVEGAPLYFGCPLSKSRFSILWRVADVKVYFGFEMRRIDILMSHGSRSFKLHLSYESTWESFI